MAMAVQGGNTAGHEMKHSGSILPNPTIVLSSQAPLIAGSGRLGAQHHPGNTWERPQPS